jgi:hypothetical protein
LSDYTSRKKRERSEEKEAIGHMEESNYLQSRGGDAMIEQPVAGR